MLPASLQEHEVSCAAQRVIRVVFNLFWRLAQFAFTSARSAVNSTRTTGRLEQQLSLSRCYETLCRPEGANRREYVYSCLRGTRDKKRREVLLLLLVSKPRLLVPGALP